ncbi:hypothetical protein K439DRAFT_1339074 [Ramaria rubella]|nr:hypothetical protein K439DRAFT_1339074 [Ramaria rubella]
MLLQLLLDRLVNHLNLLLGVSLVNVNSFMQLATLAKPTIAFQTINIPHPPAHLPLNVHVFLADALDCPWDMVKHCWEIFADVVWSSTGLVAATSQNGELFCCIGLL